MLFGDGCIFGRRAHYFFFFRSRSRGWGGKERKGRGKKEMAWDRDRAERDVASAGIPWDGILLPPLSISTLHIGRPVRIDVGSI